MPWPYVILFQHIYVLNQQFKAKFSNNKANLACWYICYRTSDIPWKCMSAVHHLTSWIYLFITAELKRKKPLFIWHIGEGISCGVPQNTVHFLPLFFTGGGHKTARMASSNTVFKPRWVRAEHSRYFTAPTKPKNPMSQLYMIQSPKTIVKHHYSNIKKFKVIFFLYTQEIFITNFSSHGKSLRVSDWS